MAGVFDPGIFQTNLFQTDAQQSSVGESGGGGRRKGGSARDFTDYMAALAEDERQAVEVRDLMQIAAMEESYLLGLVKRLLRA